MKARKQIGWMQHCHKPAAIHTGTHTSFGFE